MTAKTDPRVENEATTVLVVDDETDIADLYTAWLTTTHDVMTAYDGEEALQYVDDTVDVIFLDRQMPGKSGDEVLDIIDSRELDCRVVMVTAVDPDFDIVEMPFDDYLTKPVTRTELVEKVDEMMTRDSYDEQMQEYFSLASKKATLESEKYPAELEANEDYKKVSQRVEELKAKGDSTAAEFDDFEAVFSEFPGSS